MSVYSTRKLVSGLMLLCVGVGMTLFKGDIPPNLLSLMQALYAAFVLGNATEHYTNWVKNDKQPR